MTERSIGPAGASTVKMTKEDLATFVARKTALTKKEAMEKTIKQLEALRNSLIQPEDRSGFLSGIKTGLKKETQDSHELSKASSIKRRGGGIAKRGMGIAK